MIKLKVAWKLGYQLEPDWPVEEGWLICAKFVALSIEIQGEPNIRCLYQQKTSDHFDPGTLTAMPAIHAIPAVCAAAPGIVTAVQLPLVVAAHCVIN